jgi:pyruvate dehydrogenase (quinone)
VIRPDDAALAAAADVLNAAEAVTILAGAGCAGAHDQLIVLAGALKAPIVHAFRGKEFVEYDNPYDVGMTGLIGFSSGYRAMEHCDALVMLGTDFPYRPFLPQAVPVIQVDVRGEQIGRRIPVQVPLAGTVGATVDALLPLIAVKADTTHLDRMTAHYRRARARLDKLARDRANDSPLHPQFVAATIDKLAARDAARRWSMSAPPGRSCRCRPNSPTASSRASPCTPPGRSFPAVARNSSSSPRPTCANSTSNERRDDHPPGPETTYSPPSMP